MPVNLLNDTQYCAPSAATGASLTLPGSSWTNSAFAELAASVDADSILTGITLRPSGTIFSGYSFEVDIATGAASAESVIGTFRGYLQEVNASVGGFGMYLPTMIGIDNIASGARLSACIRAGTTLTTPFFVSATYLKKPLNGTLLTTANPLLVLPSAASSISVTSGVTWANGTVVELRPSAGPSMAIVAVPMIVPVATLEWELDLLLGEANDLGTTLRGSIGGVSSFPNDYMLPHPFVVPEATRLAMRLRTNSVAARTGTVALNYFEVPLS